MSKARRRRRVPGVAGVIDLFRYVFCYDDDRPLRPYRCLLCRQQPVPEPGEFCDECAGYPFAGCDPRRGRGAPGVVRRGGGHGA